MRAPLANGGCVRRYRWGRTVLPGGDAAEPPPSGHGCGRTAFSSDPSLLSCGRDIRGGREAQLYGTGSADRSRDSAGRHDLRTSNEPRAVFSGAPNNPFKFYNTAVGIRSSADLDSVLQVIRCQPPKLVFYDPTDKYILPPPFASPAFWRHNTRSLRESRPSRCSGREAKPGSGESERLRRATGSGER